MHSSVVLTAKEFKDIHNTLCDLDSLADSMAAMAPKPAKELRKKIKALRKGLSGAYKQDDSVYQARSNHYEMVRKSHKMEAIWSVYEIPNLFTPHPFAGAKTLSYDGWTVTIDGPNWIDLYLSADVAIEISGDKHHIYIEGFRADSEDDSILILSTGS